MLDDIDSLTPQPKTETPPPVFHIRRLFRLSNTAQSTAAVIPLAYLRLLGWAPGDYVKIAHEGDRLILSRVR